jgi:hypothetical protein
LQAFILRAGALRNPKRKQASCIMEIGVWYV